MYQICFFLIVTTTKAKKGDASRHDSSNMTSKLCKDVLISESWDIVVSVSLWQGGGLPWQAARAAVMSASHRIPANAIFDLFFSLDWGEESRGEQRTDQFNSSVDTPDTAAIMHIYIFFITPNDLKQRIKYKKVPYDNIRNITKGSPGPPKGKKQ